VPDIDRLRAGLDELQADITPLLEPMITPGLVLAARNDPLVPPKVSENLCGLTREGALLWHETAGHLLPLRDPEWCANAIKDFLS
jgi:pimeloyl-[acyl-carrier protein] methyl ester esterase